MCIIWLAATLHLASCCPEASVSLWIVCDTKTNVGDPGSITGITNLKSLLTLGHPALIGRDGL